MTHRPPAAMPAPTDVLVVAVWSAAVFGLAEGILLDAARFWPRLLAPYKASAHQLYLAPLVDVALFAALVPLLLAALRLGRRVVRARGHALVLGAYTFLGAFTVGWTLKVLHPASVFILALGIAAAGARAAAGREAGFVAWLRRRLLVVPLAIVLVAAGVFAWSRYAEGARVRALPPVEAAR